MKLFFLLICLSFIGCSFNKMPQEDPAKTVTNTDFAKQHQVSAENQNGFVEENSQCICTKEYSPVCGDDNITYPNSCQAGCAKVKSHTKGACETKN